MKWVMKQAEPAAFTAWKAMANEEWQPPTTTCGTRRSGRCMRPCSTSKVVCVATVAEAFHCPTATSNTSDRRKRGKTWRSSMRTFTLPAFERHPLAHRSIVGMPRAVTSRKTSPFHPRMRTANGALCTRRRMVLSIRRTEMTHQPAIWLNYSNLMSVFFATAAQKR